MATPSGKAAVLDGRTSSAPIPTTMLSDDPFQPMHRKRSPKAIEVVHQFVK
jgi:hypothetical protein